MFPTFISSRLAAQHACLDDACGTLWEPAMATGCLSN